MSMTLEQVRDQLRCTDETGLNAEACYALGEAIDAHLARQSKGVSDEDVEIAGAHYFDYQWEILPAKSKEMYRAALRRALQSYLARHNRPAQDSDAYRQGFIDGSKAVSAQENAEPAAVPYVYPTKPNPRAWGYLDNSGVEWAAYDTSQMDAYARAAIDAERLNRPHEATIDFAGNGMAGPFPIKEGNITLPQITIDDLLARTAPPDEQAQEKAEPVAWRSCYSRVIKALAAIVTVHTPDNLFDLDAIPRDPVMAEVTRIRMALDEYGKVSPPAERVRVPDGWKLVPIKMTEEMQRAGSGFIYIENAWNAVLDAAPEADHD